MEFDGNPRGTDGRPHGLCDTSFRFLVSSARTSGIHRRDGQTKELKQEKKFLISRQKVSWSIPTVHDVYELYLTFDNEHQGCLSCLQYRSTRSSLYNLRIQCIEALYVSLCFYRLKIDDQRLTTWFLLVLDSLAEAWRKVAVFRRKQYILLLWNSNAILVIMIIVIR